jgi:hypothetical protein
MATNSVGDSSLSNIVDIFKASVPSTPQNPKVILNGDFIDFSWEVPQDNGSALLTYKVLVLTSDGVTFEQEVTNCNSYD